MSTIAFDQFALTRIADFARSLSRLHQASRRRPVDDDQIDREFNAVCMSVWGYTTDDFSDDLFSVDDHAWLDSLDEAHARIFAAEQGYDLVDDHGMLTDWWGYCWMILAEKRGSVDAGKPRRGARANRGKIPVGAERHRRHCRAIGSGYSASARLPVADDVFGTIEAGSVSASGSGACSASVSALTGATFISPSRARTSGVKPG